MIEIKQGEKIVGMIIREASDPNDPGAMMLGRIAFKTLKIKGELSDPQSDNLNFSNLDEL